MGIYDWRDARPKKSSFRYSADEYRYIAVESATYSPCMEGHVWLPPADFADFLADEAHRLVVFAEESFDDDYSIYDTRNWDAYGTTSREFETVAKRLYEIAAAKFEQALAKDLDLDLDGATIRYWSDRIVLKWGDTSLKFEKPSSWELYQGFEKIAAARSLDTLRALPAATGKVPRGNDDLISEELRELLVGRPLPRNRVVPAIFRADREDASSDDRYEFDKFGNFRDWNSERMLLGYTWIAPTSWSDFESGQAERLIVVQKGNSEYEVHSPRTNEIIAGSDYWKTIERLFNEAYENFRRNLEVDLGLDLSGAKLAYRGNSLYIGIDDADVSLWYHDDEWHFGKEWGDWDNIKEEIRRIAPQILKDVHHPTTAAP